MVDSAIRRINLCPLDSAIGFLNTYLLEVIYPVDNAIQRLNNQGQIANVLVRASDIAQSRSRDIQVNPRNSQKHAKYREIW